MKSIFQHTWNYLEEQEKRKFIIFVLLDLFISFLDIAFLAALLWIIQFYMSPEGIIHNSFLPGWLLNKDSIALLGIFFLLFASKNLLGIRITRSQFLFNSEVALRISKGKLQHFQSSGFDDFIKTDSSVHIRNIHFQPFEFCQYLLTGMQQLLTQSFLISFVTIAIIFFNAPVFLALLTFLLPPVIAVFYYVKRKMTLAKKEVQVNNERSFQHLLDALKGYVESNIYNANRFFLDRFMLFRKRFSTFLFESLSLQTMPSRLIESSAILGLLLLIMVAKQFSVSGTLLLTIGAFMAAAYKIIPGMVKLINISGQMKAYEFLFDKEDKSQEETRLSPASSIHTVELRNVEFEYNGKSILKDFNLQAEKGCFLGICGRSGIGKTTLFNLLLGFYPPSGGHILFNEIPRSQAQLKAFWPSVAYVKQQNFLIHDTIARNICFEEEINDPEMLENALMISGLNELTAGYPDGMHKVIYENGRDISGGQQQRIGIARALYKNADLVLLDEPFSELDDASEVRLLEYFRQKAESGKIIIMISHNSKALDYCHKIISLDEEDAKNTGNSYAGISVIGG